MRFCVRSPGLASFAQTGQMGGDSIGEAVGFESDVMHDDGNHRPPKFLDFAQPLFVAEHLGAPCVPVDALVFGGQTCRWPCEVDAPQLAAAAMDWILELRRRQCVVDHHEPCFTLHRRFGAAVGDGEEFAHCDDASTTSLLGHSNFNFVAGALH